MRLSDVCVCVCVFVCVFVLCLCVFNRRIGQLHRRQALKSPHIVGLFCP